MTWSLQYFPVPYLSFSARKFLFDGIDDQIHYAVKQSSLKFFAKAFVYNSISYFLFKAEGNNAPGNCTNSNG